ncbi:MAG: hypothetical protein NWE89_16955 [Candidatus Bathyarchaeota archaeon]|nr:hypothetical protein [Candidatus Bathyarchaeota archaeon]
MDYFDKLKNEQVLCYHNIINDIDVYRTRTKDPSLHESIRLFRRIVENNLDDIDELDSPFFESWQGVSYAHFKIKEFESYLSDLSIRFGLPRFIFRDAHNILDAICHEIIERQNMDREPFPFLGIFGGDRYRKVHPMNFIWCRFTDYYRYWNLGFVAHELGHDILESYIEPDPVFHSSPFDDEGKPIIEDIVENWEIEIISDIIGTLSVGPSLLHTHAMAPTFWAFHPGSEAEYLRTFHTHPPCELRFHIHNRILTDLGIANDFPIPDLVDLYKDIDLSESPEYEELFSNRVRNIQNSLDTINEKFDRLYPHLKENIRFFSSDEWDLSKEIADRITKEEDLSLDEYSPVQVLNGLIFSRTHELSVSQEEEIMQKILKVFTC